MDTKESTTAELQKQLSTANAERDAARRRVAELEETKAALDSEEELIVAKMERGLNRQQAINVIRRQRQYYKDNPDRTPEHVEKRLQEQGAE